MTKADGTEYDVPTILMACGKAWIIGSVTTPIMMIIWFGMTTWTPSDFQGFSIFSLLGFFALLAGIFFAAALFSLPYMALIATPAALIVARQFGDHRLVNAMVGAGVGVAVGYAFRLMPLDTGLLLLPVVAIYGAATGFYVTRMMYA